MIIPWKQCFAATILPKNSVRHMEIFVAILQLLFRSELDEISIKFEC